MTGPTVGVLSAVARIHLSRGNDRAITYLDHSMCTQSQSLIQYHLLFAVANLDMIVLTLCGHCGILIGLISPYFDMPFGVLVLILQRRGTTVFLFRIYHARLCLVDCGTEDAYVQLPHYPTPVYNACSSD